MTDPNLVPLCVLCVSVVKSPSVSSGQLRALRNLNPDSHPCDVPSIGVPSIGALAIGALATRVGAYVRVHDTIRANDDDKR